MLARKTVAVTVIALLTIAASSAAVYATAHTGRGQGDHPKPSGTHLYSAWTKTPPSIDGVFQPREWDKAEVINFVITYNVRGPINGTMYAMNDANNLYLAVRVPDLTFNVGDNLVFYFDNNNTGVQSKGDDILQMDVNSLLTSNISFFDEFWSGCCGPVGGLEDRAAGGTTDGAGQMYGDGSYNYFELVHPLNSGDVGHDFSLKPGDTVGFLVSYDDDGGIGSFWPSALPGVPNYAERAQLTIANPPGKG